MGGGANMLGEILSSFTIFPDTINFDSIYTGATNSCSKIGGYTAALISLWACSSSEQLKNIDVSLLFLIAVTIAGVDKKAKNINNNMRAINFIGAKIELNEQNQSKMSKNFKKI